MTRRFLRRAASRVDHHRARLRRTVFPKAAVERRASAEPLGHAGWADAPARLIAIFDREATLRSVGVPPSSDTGLTPRTAGSSHQNRSRMASGYVRRFRYSPG